MAPFSLQKRIRRRRNVLLLAGRLSLRDRPHRICGNHLEKGRSRISRIRPARALGGAAGTLPASLEQRLAAYYISSAEGERNQLEKVLTAKRAVSPFEQDFVKLLLSGEKGASGVSGDALFTYRTVKLLEKAEADSLKTDVMSCWVFHVIQHIRAAAAVQNERAWAAAIAYVWKEANGEKTTKKETAAVYGITPATLSKYIRQIDDILE